MVYIDAPGVVDLVGGEGIKLFEIIEGARVVAVELDKEPAVVVEGFLGIEAGGLFEERKSDMVVANFCVGNRFLAVVFFSKWIDTDEGIVHGLIVATALVALVGVAIVEGISGYSTLLFAHISVGVGVILAAAKKEKKRTQE